MNRPHHLFANVFPSEKTMVEMWSFSWMLLNSGHVENTVNPERRF